MIIFLLFCILPYDNIIHDKVDKIEQNFFYDSTGRLVFSQYVFYDWNGKEGRFDVVDWRMNKSPHQYPIKDHKNNIYKVRWTDTQSGDVSREIHADIFCISHTEYDIELVEREFLLKDKRRELSKPKPLKPQLVIPSNFPIDEDESSQP